MTSIGLERHLAQELQAAPVASRTGAGANRERLRRSLNVVVAVAGIVFTVPIMLVIMIAIRLGSKGPILFTQTRVGVDRRQSAGEVTNARRRSDMGGQPFKIFKFRSMNATNGEADHGVWAAPEDPRVTAVGRVLRLYRLDELPQLFNVLLGDMNVVGPRPEQPNIFRELREEITGYHGRQAVLPGITGWAQVNHHYDESVEDVKRKLVFDLQYVSRRSAAEDLRIMARTLPVVIFKRGAW